MLKIGITGGIGSGKSTVAKIFETLGVPVYYADDASKRLMNEDEDLKQLLRKNFGDETYVDGKLNRPYLAAIIFKNEEKLALLNSFVHPATIEDGKKWMAQQNTPYAIKEAAIIFESRSNIHLDKIIGVYTPLPIRIQRVMQRDGLSKGEVEARISKQLDEEEKMRLCDIVINNNDQEMLIPQVLKIHQALLNNS